MKKKLVLTVALLLCVFLLVGCSDLDSTASRKDTDSILGVADILQENQPTPTDVTYSATRYALIRRAYWQNGMYEKAASLPRPIEMAIGYIALFSGSALVDVCPVDGPVVSMETYLTPNSIVYETVGDYLYGNSIENEWLADVDGTYGENVEGIFWFTPSGHYRETRLDYIYYDEPIIVENPVITVKNSQSN